MSDFPEGIIAPEGAQELVDVCKETWAVIQNEESSVPDSDEAVDRFETAMAALAARACGGSPPHERLRSRISRHLQCCPFWCPRGIPAGRHYPRGTGGGAGDGLPDVHEIASNPHTRFSLKLVA